MFKEIETNLLDINSNLSFNSLLQIIDTYIYNNIDHIDIIVISKIKGILAQKYLNKPDYKLDVKLNLFLCSNNDIIQDFFAESFFNNLTLTDKCFSLELENLKKEYKPFDCIYKLNEYILSKKHNDLYDIANSLFSFCQEKESFFFT